MSDARIIFTIHGKTLVLVRPVRTTNLPEAAINFGAVPMSLSRWTEAISILEGVSPKLDLEAQSIVVALVEQGRAQFAASSRNSVKATR